MQVLSTVSILKYDLFSMTVTLPGINLFIKYYRYFRQIEIKTLLFVKTFLPSSWLGMSEYIQNLGMGLLHSELDFVDA